MSLVKLPFLISVALGNHIVMTPPQPPPLPEERIKLTGPLVIITWVLPPANIFFAATALFESAVILANAYPSHSISSWVLFALVHVPNPSDAASKIRLTPLFLLGWVSALIGVIIRYHCYSAMGTLFTFDLSIRKDHKLITSGPYSIVRHPGYSGSIFAVVGVVITHLSNGSWVMECSGLMWWVLESIWIAAVLALLPLIGPRSKKEDNMLKKEFGKQWEEWAMNVPYRLFPGIY